MSREVWPPWGCCSRRTDTKAQDDTADDQLWQVVCGSCQGRARTEAETSCQHCDLSPKIPAARALCLTNVLMPVSLGVCSQSGLSDRSQLLAAWYMH